MTWFSWSANPMSSMRSASSRTTTSTSRRSAAPCHMRSSRRPGVATMISGRCPRPRTCACMSAPPTTVVAYTRDERPSWSMVSWIWNASSRVGARTRPRGGPSGEPASRSTMGTTKAAVLPVPVWAQPSMSRPCRAGAMAFAWMGVGVTKPIRAKSSSSGPDRPKDSKVSGVGMNECSLPDVFRDERVGSSCPGRCGLRRRHLSSAWFVSAACGHEGDGMLRRERTWRARSATAPVPGASTGKGGG